MSADEQDSDGSDLEYWVDLFLGTKGNEYFCEIEEDYITDRFNLTGLNSEVPMMKLALDLITDELKLSDVENTNDEFTTLTPEEKERKTQELLENIEYNARTLYGLIHARYILSNKGLSKMEKKFANGDFGYCPRVNCHLQALLPMGLDDQPKASPVKLYCVSCESLYKPKLGRHTYIDGAYFGSSFPGMFFQTYTQHLPVHKTEMFCPKIHGFELHSYSKLNRWRILQRNKLISRLESNGVAINEVPGGFKDDTDDQDE